MKLSYEQRVDWLRLIRTNDVGPLGFKQRINQYGGAKRALQALSTEHIGAKRKRPKIPPSIKEIEDELRLAESMGIQMVANGEDGYPRLLEKIMTAPPMLAIQGNLEVLKRPMVGLVGSRNASHVGITLTQRYASALGELGYVIVSGLARGIDYAAHQAALNTGTVAVLPGGLAKIYPQKHAKLAEQILEHGGALVSEMPLGWEARSEDFPKRNRILSGVSYGVLVVEGTMKSGSMITARFALDQGREVFAFPGCLLDPRSEAPNYLLKQGATFVTRVEDITETLEAMLKKISRPDQDYDQDPYVCFDRTTMQFKTPQHSDQLEFMFNERYDDTPISSEVGVLKHGDDTSLDILLGNLSYVPTALDVVVRNTGLSIQEIQARITELELEQRVVRHLDGRVALLE